MTPEELQKLAFRIIEEQGYISSFFTVACSDGSRLSRWNDKLTADEYDTLVALVLRPRGGQSRFNKAHDDAVSRQTRRRR